MAFHDEKNEIQYFKKYTHKIFEDFNYGLGQTYQKMQISNRTT